MYEVDILLATYNGEKYLSDQIDSLFEQTFEDWRLLVRDDGSSDDTVSIIRSLMLEYPDKVVFVEDELGNVGPSRSFAALLSHSEAPYVAFCDQDDIWMKGKLGRQVEAMLEVEASFGSNFPILIHSDLTVVDESLELIADSFWQYQNINPEKMNALRVLLLENYVTGCTCLLNRKLIEAASPIPDAAIMHDWWIALVALLKGEVVEIEEASIRYRQHDANDTGAKSWGISFLLKKILAGPALIRDSLKKTRNQAVALYQLPGLDDDQKTTIQSYVELYDRNWLARRVLLVKNKFHMHGLIRNIGLFFMV